MKGSIRKRGSTYQYRISYKEGEKRKYIERSGFKFKKECELAMNKALEEINNTGSFIKVKNKKLEEIYEEFITKEAPLTKKITTIISIESLYSGNLKLPLGNMYIHQIKPIDIQELYLDKINLVSYEHIVNIHSLLNMIFKYALKMEYIKENIMHKVTKPKKKKSENKIEIYTKEQLTWMLNRFKGTKYMTPYMLGLHLGARSGEVYGLRWSDFDFENNLVCINKQLQFIKNKWVLNNLKTKNSYRTITFSNILKKYLLEEKARQEQLEKIQPFELYDNTNNQYKKTIIFDFVNKTPDGKKATKYVCIKLGKICKDEGGFKFKFHNLRHTHATMLLEKGINPKYIQKRLGHATLEFTLRLYTHITKNMDVKSIEISDDVFNL